MNFGNFIVTDRFCAIATAKQSIHVTKATWMVECIVAEAAIDGIATNLFSNKKDSESCQSCLEIVTG
jgi:hypothetical protein